MAYNLDQTIKDTLHRSKKKMQFFIGGRYPLHIIAMRLKIFSIRLKIDALTLERDETSIAYCSVLRRVLTIWSMFSAFFQSFCNKEIFIRLNLSILLVQVRRREKSQKYIHRSFGI